MKIKGKVINTSMESKILVGKDGLKAEHKIGHIVMLVPDEDGSMLVANVRTFDHELFMTSDKLPEKNKDWTTPPVRKYECYDGSVADVTI